MSRPAEHRMSGHMKDESPAAPSCKEDDWGQSLVHHRGWQRSWRRHR